MSTNILLTGVGLDAGPDIIRALRTDPELDARVVGVDADPDQPGRHLADAFHSVPPRDDPAYLDAVREIAETERAAAIYPLPTFDQEIFAKAASDLRAAGRAVPVSPPEAIRNCNDKWVLYEHLRGTSPELVPETTRVESAAELRDAVHALGYPERRVCVRRRTSRGAIGLRLLDAGADRLDALLHQNPGSLLTSLDEFLDTLSHASSFPEYLVQEYLAPDEWDADVLCREGEAVIVATRRNLAMTGAGAVRAVLEPSPEVAARARELVAELSLHAVVNIAFRYDREGRLKLLEINPRIPFSVLCALGGGANLPALAVRQELGERIEPAEPRWGAMFVRHFQSLITDADGSRVA